MNDRGMVKDGRLYVYGRADDLVITQYGEKVYPMEIEESLIKMDGVADVHVHAGEDKKTGQALRAFVITDEAADSDITAEQVRTWIEKDLTKAHVPRDVVFVNEFNYSPTGKVIKRHLPHYGEQYSD